MKVSIPWHKFLAIINAKLKDPSARSLLETTVSLRRDDNCDLHTWVRTFIMTQELCGQKKISLPYSVWYSYFIHQLTSKERRLCRSRSRRPKPPPTSTTCVRTRPRSTT